MKKKFKPKGVTPSVAKRGPKGRKPAPFQRTAPLSHNDFWKKTVNANVVGKEADLIRLSAQRRAIGNFATIIVGRQIPVRFATQGDSYTDGKRITISSEIAKDNIDIIVGLALHEASHIRYSDFDIVERIVSGKMITSELRDAGEAKGMNISEISQLLKLCLNVVEDRFIDDATYDCCPGYRGYYQALYGAYFYAESIGEVIKSDKYRDEKVNSYIFRFINIIHEDVELDALTGLQEIYNVLQIDSISRLKTMIDRFDVASKITKIILDHIQVYSLIDVKYNPPPVPLPGKAVPGKSDETSDEAEKGEGNAEPNDKEGEESESEKGEGEASDDPKEGEKKDSEGKTTSEDSEDEGSADGDSEDDESSTKGGTSDKENESGSGGKESSDADIDDSELGEFADIDSAIGGTEESNAVGKLEDAIQSASDDDLTTEQKIAIDKQKQFVNGEGLDKSILSSDASRLIQAIERANAHIVEIGGEHGVPSTQCIVVDRIDAEFINSSQFPYRTVADINNCSHISFAYIEQVKAAVTKGVSLGQQLGRKLKIRDDAKETKFTHQKIGRLNPRQLHEIPSGGTDLFYHREVSSFKKTEIHISIDASSSMQGIAWANTMTFVVAIAKAASMIQNLNVVISLRSGIMKNPYIVIAYDSKVDKFSKITQLFPFLGPNGSTPEGLTYQAIQDKITPSHADLDSYFLNISDGEPCMFVEQVYYSGERAISHTNAQIKKMIQNGIQIISYFVSNDEANSESSIRTMRDFSRMYGRDSFFVDVNSIVKIAETMNRKFLQK